MKAVFRINAAPGFERSVETAVGKHTGVFSVVRDKDRSFDLIVAVEAEDAARIQALENRIRWTTGLVGLKRVERPARPLLQRLRRDHAAHPSAPVSG